MEDFYTRVLGLSITDRGPHPSLRNSMVFMSTDPTEHHQFVLITGRPKENAFNICQQLAFTVASLDELRLIRDRVLEEGEVELRAVSHGNAWSIYFKDPEDNTVEMYVHTPWYVPQPHDHTLDFSLSNEEIERQTEDHCQLDPQYLTRIDRERILANMIEG